MRASSWTTSRCRGESSWCPSAIRSISSRSTRRLDQSWSRAAIACRWSSSIAPRLLFGWVGVLPGCRSNGRAPEVAQLLAASLPGGDVEPLLVPLGIQFHRGEYLRPQGDALRLVLHRHGELPQAGRVVLAAGQHGPALDVTGQAPDALLMRPGRTNGNPGGRIPQGRAAVLSARHPQPPPRAQSDTPYPPPLFQPP